MEKVENARLIVIYLMGHIVDWEIMGSVGKGIVLIVMNNVEKFGEKVFVLGTSFLNTLFRAEK